jgi:hypothetical protein
VQRSGDADISRAGPKQANVPQRRQVGERAQHHNVTFVAGPLLRLLGCQPGQLIGLVAGLETVAAKRPHDPEVDHLVGQAQLAALTDRHLVEDRRQPGPDPGLDPGLFKDFAAGRHHRVFTPA